ncbi:MAG: hypothetical protein A2Y17_08145 [Clostridiales bacterium GWF2_38_85]|nr:MAG: hypothetical protein A2Y17_08145 [Clostridiales bacterium GWF2_38_85]HBL83837.1 hypothetical protein [Clostridiales bacterium]
MINKILVGNRISALRKNKKLSQNILADEMGVTTQAVSKWETGLALPDVEILINMSHFFNIPINEILEGKNIISKIANRVYEMNEIAYFVPEKERDYNDEWAKDIKDGNWIKKNWEWNKSNIEARLHIAKRVISHSGLILEIGTGPGGGYMPAILLEKPDSEIIISDLSPTVVLEWKKLFENEFFPPNVHYVALDNCDLPFYDNSIDVISAGGGFGNTEGDKFKALIEIYRVLKPGGLYITGDGFVTGEMLKSLPEKAQKVLLEKRPDIFEDYYEATVTAGFKTIDNIIRGGWSTENDQSTIADLARELGVVLKFSGYLRCCIK